MTHSARPKGRYRAARAAKNLDVDVLSMIFNVFVFECVHISVFFFLLVRSRLHFMLQSIVGKVTSVWDPSLLLGTLVGSERLTDTATY